MAKFKFDEYDSAFNQFSNFQSTRSTQRLLKDSMFCGFHDAQAIVDVSG